MCRRGHRLDYNFDCCSDTDFFESDRLLSPFDCQNSIDWEMTGGTSNHSLACLLSSWKGSPLRCASKASFPEYYQRGERIRAVVVGFKSGVGDGQAMRVSRGQRSGTVFDEGQSCVRSRPSRRGQAGRDPPVRLPEGRPASESTNP